MIKVIKTEADYAAALAQIERLMDLNPTAGTPEAEELEVLALLVQNYESRHLPTARPDPIEALSFAWNSRGLRSET